MATVALFGGTGFLGERLAQRFAAEGHSVRVAVRNVEWARHILAAGGLERVEICRADIRDRDDIVRVVAGVDAVVNAVSAYVEADGVTFEAVHQRGAEALAREATAAGATHHVLVSGIGADPNSGSAYIRARGRGERLTTQAFPGTTIVRPSTMFGPGDALLDMIAGMARLLPVLPLVGNGRTRLQPVYVMDVAEAIARSIDDPGSCGRTYEFGGPVVYTLREIYALALHLTGRRRVLMPVPLALAGFGARLFELLPRPLLTTGQVDLLRADNVASGTLPGLRELGVEPKAITDVLPLYRHGGHRRA